MAVQRSRHRFGLLNMPMTRYGKDYFKVAKIVIVAVKSYFHILVLAVMVTVQQSFPVVTNAVTTINDRCPTAILKVEATYQFLRYFLLYET